MTKLSASMKVNESVATAADIRLSLFETSDCRTPRKGRQQYVSRQTFIQLLLSRQKLVRFDDHHIGIRGLMDPTTGDYYCIDEHELLDNQPTAQTR